MHPSFRPLLLAAVASTLAPNAARPQSAPSAAPTATTLALLSRPTRLAVRAGDLVRAGDWAAQAVKVSDESLKPGDPSRVKALAALAGVEGLRNRLPESQAAHRRVISECRAE